VELSDGSRRQIHANKLRPFIGRVQNVGIIRDQDVDFGKVEYALVGVEIGPTHLAHLKEFLKTIRVNGLTLNLKKCSFAKQNVKYLGHLIGGNSHQPDPERLDAVVKMTAPSTKKQLRQVLGLFLYYHTHVRDFATIAKLLTDLTAMRMPALLNWAESEQNAFETLQRLVCDAPVMAIPMPGKPFNLYTDASAVALGCQLTQYDDNMREHPVAYARMKLSATQSSWSVIEREAFTRKLNRSGCTLAHLWGHRHPRTYFLAVPRRFV